MKRVLAIFVLQLLLTEQKEYHVAGASNLIPRETTISEPDSLKKVITRDES